MSSVDGLRRRRKQKEVEERIVLTRKSAGLMLELDKDVDLCREAEGYEAREFAGCVSFPKRPTTNYLGSWWKE